MSENSKTRGGAGMSRAPQRIPESGVLRACLDLLGYSKIWHERRNTGGMEGEYNGKKRFVKFSEKGTPDIMATPRTRGYIGQNMHPSAWLLWIECKSDSGKQTKEQKEFQQRAEAAGHHYLLVRDVDTLRDWLKEHGV